MDKNERKEAISQYIDLGNSRLKDHEVEALEWIIDQHEDLDGISKIYRNSYKTFDSEDTYRVTEEVTYTFCSDSSGIYIEKFTQSDWDDGQHDEDYKRLDSVRDILKFISIVWG